MRKVCVYCGANSGRQPEYRHAARLLADEFVERNIGLVYGGASIGMMGELADRVMARGGHAFGVIPKSFVENEVPHTGLSGLVVVENTHERKAMMAEIADGFIALPGGFGTMEELFEILAWAQLGFHRKPCGLLNVHGYFDGLMTFLNHAVEEQFIKPVHRQLLLSDSKADKLLERMLKYRQPLGDKWVIQGSASNSME